MTWQTEVGAELQWRSQDIAVARAQHGHTTFVQTSAVWQECSRELRRSLERVQNYGMRLILSKPPRTPSEQLREELGWKTLEERRSRSRLYLVHKCVTGQAPTSLCQRVEVNTRNTRGGLKLVLPRPKTDFFKKSFCFRGAQDWNTLPSDIRTSNNSTTFRARLR